MTEQALTPPAAPCKCGSGFTYAQCHQQILEAPDEEMLPIAWQLYSDSWAVNADHYESQGLYTTLANHLANSCHIQRVFDIGCGRGHGLAAIRDVLPSDARIIGVDENPKCLYAAAQHLNVVALDENVRRTENRILPNGYQLPTFREGSLVDQGPLTLIQSDVALQDKALEEFLDDASPFDAVSLWFSGVHKARSATEISRNFEIRNDADHRLLVEDRALTIASERVRPGGVLHLVNRVGAINIDAVCREMEQIYRQWPVNEPFTFEVLKAIPYREPIGGVLVRSADAEVNAMPNFAISILFRRRD